MCGKWLIISDERQSKEKLLSKYYYNVFNVYSFIFLAGECCRKLKDGSIKKINK